MRQVFAHRGASQCPTLFGIVLLCNSVNAIKDYTLNRCVLVVDWD